jgi:outer membrane lipoprotein SlyB
MMLKSDPWRSASRLAIACLLAGCAARHVAPPTPETSPLQGRLNFGTVISVRTVMIAKNGGTTVSILSALGVTAPAGSWAGVELVIRRQDLTVTSVVQREQLGQPRFVPGERVAIAEAAATIVRPE